MLIKLIRHFFPALPSSVNIAKSYFSDASRFIRFNTNNRHRNIKNKHSAMLVRKTHGVEKAFSLPDMKRVFGKTQAKALFDELIAYQAIYGLEDIVIDSIRVLNNYFGYHRNVNDKDIINLFSSYEHFVDSLATENDVLEQECFLRYEKYSSMSRSDYSTFFRSRCSVRNFKKTLISIEMIVWASNVASKTPSACNRQPWRIRVYNDRKSIEKALHLQNGNRGFSEYVNNLVVISGFVSYFSSKERNQVFIDCGMYSMSFILALHSQGIASCPLNMSYQTKDEKKVASVLGFEKDEVPIMMIAFGEAGDETLCANSYRKHADHFVSFEQLS